MFADLLFSLRSLIKAKGFTAMAVLTLTLGTATSIGIFAVVNCVVFHPLPYADPEGLARLYGWKRGEPVEAATLSVSIPNYAAWRETNRSFRYLAAFQDGVTFQITGGDEPYNLDGARVTHEFFQLLGREPFMGRGFTAADELPTPEPPLILSYGLWRQKFASDPKVLGTTMKVNGHAFVIVGVMGRDFHFPNDKVEIWAPLQISPFASPWARSLQVLGRLAPQVTLGGAQKEMSAIAARLERENPGPNRDMGVHLVPLKKDVVGQTEGHLRLFLGAVGLVLLIACVNALNLLLVHSLGRQREIAVRVVYGASRLRILRQFLIESLLLAGASVALGLVLAHWLIRFFISISPPGFPRLAELGIDAETVVLAVAVAAVIGLVLGAASAVAARGWHSNEALKSGTRGTEGIQRQRLRQVLVMTEIALAVVLLIGAGLMLVSFVRLFRVSSGFEAKGLLTLQFSLPKARYPTGDQEAIFFTQALRRAAAVPGVESVGMVSHLPLSGSNVHWTYTQDGMRVEVGQEPEAGYRVVDSDYFRTMKIPLLRGRSFNAADHLKGAAEVAIVNQTMARTQWKGQDPVGKRFKLGNVASDQPWMTVVGIAGDVRHDSLAVPAEAEFFLPFSPEWWDSMTLVVRSRNPGSLVGPIRAAFREIDRDLPLYNVRTMEEVLTDSFARQRFNLILTSIFATLALVLAAIGIYGVMAQSVVQQTRKIAVQMALGASRRGVLIPIVEEGMFLAAIGLAAGLAVALYSSRLMQSLLFGVTPSDPLTFVGVAAAFLVVALIAVSVPAMRAVRVDPMTCLKE